MSTRTSTRQPARDAQAAIKGARSAKGFEKAPGAKKGKAGKSGVDYEKGDVKSARSGPLSLKMQDVFARDTRPDPGTEKEFEVIQGRESSLVEEADEYKAQSARVANSAQVKARASKRGLNVTVTKNGAVQLRHTKTSGGRPGTVAEQVRAPFKGAGGRFTTPERDQTIERVVVRDPDEFKRAARRRVEGYGASLFGDNFTASRRAAMLAGLQRDREARGIEGVPDLD